MARAYLYDDQGNKIQDGGQDVSIDLVGAAGGSTKHIDIPGTGDLAAKYQVKLMDKAGNFSPALELTPPALTGYLTSDSGSDGTDHVTNDDRATFKVSPEYVFNSGDQLWIWVEGNKASAVGYDIASVDPNTHAINFTIGLSNTRPLVANADFASTKFHFQLQDGSHRPLSAIGDFTATYDTTAPPTVTDMAYDSSTHKVEFKLPTDVSDVDRVVLLDGTGQPITDATGNQVEVPLGTHAGDEMLTLLVPQAHRGDGRLKLGVRDLAGNQTVATLTLPTQLTVGVLSVADHGLGDTGIDGTDKETKEGRLKLTSDRNMKQGDHLTVTAPDGPNSQTYHYDVGADTTAGA